MLEIHMSLRSANSHQLLDLSHPGPAMIKLKCLEAIKDHCKATFSEGCNVVDALEECDMTLQSPLSFVCCVDV